MTSPILNPHDDKYLDSIIANLPQSILLCGQRGIGLNSIANYIASNFTKTPSTISPMKDDAIDKDNGKISIEQIRDLYSQTTSKTSCRVIIIENIEKMTTQAQNAFLKLLEEPPLNTHFILLTHAISTVLPTIVSRVTIIRLNPITKEQSSKLIDAQGINDPTKKSQILFIATGLSAEIVKLCNDDDYFTRRSDMMRQAREFIQANTYNKLAIINHVKDNRPDALQLLLDASNILKYSTLTNPQAKTFTNINQLLNAYSQIESSGNIKLTLARISI